MQSNITLKGGSSGASGKSERGLSSLLHRMASSCGESRFVAGSDPGGVPVTIWEWQDDTRWKSYPENIWNALEAVWLAGNQKLWLDLVMPGKGQRFTPVVVDSTAAETPTSDNSRWQLDTKAMLQTNISSGFKRNIRRNTNYQVLWHWRDESCGTSWQMYKLPIQRLLEDAYATTAGSATFSVADTEGGAQCEFQVDLGTMRQRRHVHAGGGAGGSGTAGAAARAGSAEGAEVRRRLTCPIQRFTLAEVDGMQRGQTMSQTQSEFCDAFHRSGVVVIRLPPKCVTTQPCHSPCGAAAVGRAGRHDVFPHALTFSESAGRCRRPPRCTPSGGLSSTARTGGRSSVAPRRSAGPCPAWSALVGSAADETVILLALSLHPY